MGHRGCLSQSKCLSGPDDPSRARPCSHRSYPWPGTPTEAIARALTLRRGVYPVVMRVEPEDPVTISQAVVGALRERWSEFGLGEDDAVVFVQTSVRGGPNQLELLRI